MSTSTPNTPQLTPTVSDPPDPASEMTLQEMLADPVVLEPQLPEPTPLGRSYAFDFTQGRLIPGANGGVLMTYGVDTLKAWERKCLATDRGAAPVHKANDFGLDGAYELIDGSTFEASTIAGLEDSVRDAMKLHPRISDITDFAIQYDDGSISGVPDDAAFVSFTVVVQGDDVDSFSVVRYPLTSPSPAQGDVDL